MRITVRLGLLLIAKPRWNKLILILMRAFKIYNNRFRSYKLAPKIMEIDLMSYTLKSLMHKFTIQE